MVVGEPEPLVEGHRAVAVLVDGGELVLAASGPKLAAELLGEGSGSADHALELALVHLAVKILVSGDESPEEDVVQLDVAVVGGVLRRGLNMTRQ